MEEAKTKVGRIIHAGVKAQCANGGICIRLEMLERSGLRFVDTSDAGSITDDLIPSGSILHRAMIATSSRTVVVIKEEDVTSNSHGSLPILSNRPWSALLIATWDPYKGFYLLAPGSLLFFVSYHR